MSVFFCGKCEYTTENKSCMDRHMSRKRPCKPKGVSANHHPPPDHEAPSAEVGSAPLSPGSAQGTSKKDDHSPYR